MRGGEGGLSGNRLATAARRSILPPCGDRWDRTTDSYQGDETSSMWKLMTSLAKRVILASIDYFNSD